MTGDSDTDPFGNPFKKSENKEMPPGTPRVVPESRESSGDPFNKYEYSDDRKDDIPPKERKDKKENINLKMDTGDIPGALKCMVSFFTIFHFDIDRKDMNAMERNFGLAPIAGFIVGAALTVVLLILAVFKVDNPFLSAALVLAAVMIVTKFLHFDGLADFGDGMIVSGERSDHIRALKDTTIGAGALGVALIVMLISLSGYFTLGINLGLMLIAVWPLEVMIKHAMVTAAAFGEPSNGMAAEQVRQTNMSSLVISLICTLIFSIVAMAIGAGFASLFGLGDFFQTDLMIRGLLIIVGSLIVATLVGYIMAGVSNKTFGFVNGDVLGATNEVARASILIVIAIVITSGL